MEINFFIFSKRATFLLRIFAYLDKEEVESRIEIPTFGLYRLRLSFNATDTSCATATG
jgi:hypothetical protein